MTSGWHRGNTEAARARKRQYNSTEHKARRAAGQRQVDAGTAYCWRCGTWLPPGSTWHLGHDDHDRTIYRGPECVPCNMRGAQANAVTIQRSTADRPRPWHSRTWH